MHRRELYWISFSDLVLFVKVALVCVCACLSCASLDRRRRSCLVTLLQEKVAGGLGGGRRSDPFARLWLKVGTSSRATLHDIDDDGVLI